MSNLDFITQSQSASFSNAVQSIVGRMCFVEFGIIKEVLAKGVVRVLISVATSYSDIRVINCALLTPASSSLMLDIIPKAGDKVLVFSPRRYSVDMFDVSKDEVITDTNSKGYSAFTAVAVLANQFRTNDYKNTLKIEDGNITLKTGYNEDNDFNALTVSTNEDGSFSAEVKAVKDGAVSSVNKVELKADGSSSLVSSKASVNIDSDGYLSYSNTSDNKSKIAFTSSGMTLQDKNGCTVESSSTSIKINGNLEIKK